MTNLRPRVPAATEKGETEAVNEFRIGDWRVQHSRNRIVRGANAVHLEPLQANLLLFLARRAGEVVTKAEILDEVWGTRFVSDSALTRTVAHLRRALDDDAHDSRYIETIPKRGYRLVAAVDWRRAELNEPRAGRRRRYAFSFAALGVGLTVLALPTLWRAGSPAESPLLVEDRPAIAVLPLSDLSSSSADYFAQSMTEALITDLAQIPSLRVTSSRSVEHYRGSGASFERIARELDVDALVEGSVLREAGRVRISVRLVDARSGIHLWAHAYDRPLKDVLLLQRDLAGAISQEILSSLRPDVVARASWQERAGGEVRSVDPEAHDLYLQGRFELSHCQAEGPNEAEELFLRALEIDPGYAPAYAGLADYYTRLYAAAHLSADEALPKARGAALTALELDDGLAEAWASLASVSFFYDWDWETAEYRFLEAIERNPSQADIRESYAVFLVSLGRFAEALAQSRRAIALDPLEARHRQEQAWVLFNAARYDDAIAALTPAPLVEDPHADLYLAWAHSLRGDFAISDALYRRVLADPEAGAKPVFLGTFGWNQARAGRKDEAIETLARLRRLPKLELDPYPLAILLAGLGDEQGALEALERAHELKSANMVFLLVEPFFEEIRDHSRYRSLLRKMNLAV